MDLYIDTTANDEIILILIDDTGKEIKKIIKAHRAQAEKLLLGIDNLLKIKKLALSDIRKIIVNNQGGSFTALRIGIITANALGYALNLLVEANNQGCISGVKQQFCVVAPQYDREPEITQKKVKK